MKIKEEIHFPTTHSEQSKTSFIIELRLIEENLKNEYGINEIVEYWDYNCEPQLLKHVFERETALHEKLNTEGAGSVNLQTAKEILRKTIDEALVNPRLIPYFFPEELSNENGQISTILVEKYEDYNPEDDLNVEIAYSKQETFIPFLKMEYLFKLAIHVKSFLVNENKEVLTFFEEELLVTEFIITKITELEFYKEFPNEQVAQKYFDTTFSENDEYFIYHIRDEEAEIKICVVKSDAEKWKFFFCAKEK
jgi:hypothetical protein